MRLKMRTLVTVLMLALSSAALVSSVNSYAATPTPAASNAPTSIWRDLGQSAAASLGNSAIAPAKYRALAADTMSLQALLASAPRESTTRAANSATVLDLPMPDGSSASFRVVESSIMEPGLAARFPQIKTYLAQGIQDRTATGRLDMTPAGFHAMTTSASGTVLIDPAGNGVAADYVSYYKKDALTPTGATIDAASNGIDRDIARPSKPSVAPTGANLKVYRLAMAASSSYTAASGGTVASAMAEITTLVNRIDAVYEREVAVRMVLVNNNDRIVYTDPATDPYSKADDLLTTNQTNTDNVIGTANYDVGHLVTKGNGGVGAVGAVCSTQSKANGYSGGSVPKGDAFYIDLVAHEMGHQFGANHTYNGSTGSCSTGRGDNSSWEPGSGSTVMSYAGTCGDENLQKNADPYFHTGTYDEITGYVNDPNGGAVCGTLNPTGNNPPVIRALQNFTIPANTYFAMTGSATDPDGDALTYSWEELDIGAASPPQGDDGSRPIFRSFVPSASPTRYFPRLSDILTKNDGAPTFGEWLPTTNRTLKLRFTARDNRAGGGGVNYGQANVQVVASQGATTYGPFRVTAPNTAVFWPSGSQQNVTWNVANTDQAPISCATVNILLSTDGGQTFPTTLAAGVPNNGSAQVTAPNTTSAAARVEVACAGNVFFDTSNVNFTIGDPNAATPTPLPTTQATATTPPDQQEFVAATVEPGGTVTTDQDNNGATANDPVETALKSPNAGEVEITEGRVSPPVPGRAMRPAAGPSDTFFGQQVDVQAPNASAANPLQITFYLDSSVVPPGQDQLTVQVYKNEVLVPNCADESGAASPDPCVAGRTLFEGDDAEVVVLSSSGGTWNFDEGTTDCQAQFSDVDTSNAFITYIRGLACRGVIGGYSDGTFRPGNPVTRGQIAKIVANALGMTGSVSGQTFQDVVPTGQPGASPFYEYIEFLTRAGYMGGYACQDPNERPGTDIPCVAPNNRPYFRPGANATRGQLSKIVSNAADFQDTPPAQTFTDVAPNSPFYVWVERLASRRAIGGYPCGGVNPETGAAEPCDTAMRPYFRPNNTVTRGQTTKIVANALLPDIGLPGSTSRK